MRTTLEGGEQAVRGHGWALTDDVRVGRNSGTVAFTHGDYLATRRELGGRGEGRDQGQKSGLRTCWAGRPFYWSDRDGESVRSGGAKSRENGPRNGRII